MHLGRKYAILAIALLLVLAAVPAAFAQDEEPNDEGPGLPIEGGVKVPLSAFLSVLVGDNVRLEAAAVLPGFSAPLVDFEALLTARYYPTFDLSVGEIPINPYFGGGGLLISSLGQAVPGFIGVVGTEFRPADIPLVVFFEAAAALPMAEVSTSIVFSFSIGGRYSFAR